MIRQKKAPAFADAVIKNTKMFSGSLFETGMTSGTGNHDMSLAFGDADLLAAARTDKYLIR